VFSFERPRIRVAGGAVMPRGQFDRSERKAATRARLLDAAARVYARRGLAGATLDEVASEAGFTKGAVYAHFGSKERLLLALLHEHLAGQISEQLDLFDRERATWERPFAGSDAWMERVQRDPDQFRLFVELWSHAQRDEAMRRRLVMGLDALRATLARFAADSASDAGLQVPAGATEQGANAMLGLILGLTMLKLADPDAVAASLLGVVASLLVRALEGSPEARELVARAGEVPAGPAPARR
jgi:AcrR family transcriptional regulator